MKKSMILLMMGLGLLLTSQVFASEKLPSTMNDNDAAMAPTAITIYVKHDASGSNDGTSWANAYTTLQDALIAANSGDQIWVAAGVYYPDEGSGQTDNDYSSTFQLKSGVAIYGGFAGTETQLTARDAESHITVLSGDIDGNDTNKDANGVISDVSDIQGENASNVVTGSGTDSSAILDGFTINAGQALNFFCQFGACGGGIYNNSGSPTLHNLTISANYAFILGGGIYNNSSNPTLKNVTISRNYAASRGGGMYNNSSNPTLTNVTLSDNYGPSGGGMANNSSNPTLTNVTISANSGGGGIYNDESNPILTNVIIWNNQANDSTTSTSASIYNEESTPTISYSLIANSGGSGAGWPFGTDGGNNIDVDPKFVSDGNPSTTPPTGGDYNLQSSSPAIDAGTNTGCPAEDIRGEPRDDGSCDIGAYEGVSQTQLVHSTFLPIVIH